MDVRLPAQLGLYKLGLRGMFTQRQRRVPVQPTESRLPSQPRPLSIFAEVRPVLRYVQRECRHWAGGTVPDQLGLSPRVRAEGPEPAV